MNLRPFIALTGFLLFVIGGLTCFVWDAILDYIMAQELPLKPNSKSFALWRDPDINLRLKVYFFNWTNPEKIFDADVKPHLVEIGPYVFREYFRKVNETWNKNKTLSFLRNRVWIFDEEESIGRLDDNITTLNPIPLSAAYTTRYSSFFMKVSLNTALRITQQKLWVTGTVGEFLFFGQSNALLTMASKMPSSFVNMPAMFDKFAWFYRRNGSETYEGTFNVETGEDDFYKAARIREWKHKSKTNAYKEECGMINGTDGLFFTPHLTREKTLESFYTEMCRTLKYDYLEDTEVMGIPGYRYMANKNVVDNGTLDPDNWCFCDGECVPYGTLNISSCHFGAPAFLSFPHFLYADPYYLQNVEGLTPNESQHRFVITVEPTVGVPLEAQARLQMNLLLQPYSDYTLYRDVPKIFFPMLWLEETFTVSDEHVALLKVLLAFPLHGLYFSIGLMLLGLILMIIAFTLWKLNKTSEGKHGRAEQNFLLTTIKPLVISKAQRAEDYNLIKMNKSENIVT